MEEEAVEAALRQRLGRRRSTAMEGNSEGPGEARHVRGGVGDRGSGSPSLCAGGSSVQKLNHNTGSDGEPPGERQLTALARNTSPRLLVRRPSLANRFIAGALPSADSDTPAEREACVPGLKAVIPQSGSRTELPTHGLSPLGRSMASRTDSTSTPADIDRGTFQASLAPDSSKPVDAFTVTNPLTSRRQAPAVIGWGDSRDHVGPPATQSTSSRSLLATSPAIGSISTAWVLGGLDKPGPSVVGSQREHAAKTPPPPPTTIRLVAQGGGPGSGDTSLTGPVQGHVGVSRSIAGTVLALRTARVLSMTRAARGPPAAESGTQGVDALSP